MWICEELESRRKVARKFVSLRVVREKKATKEDGEKVKKAFVIDCETILGLFSITHGIISLVLGRRCNETTYIVSVG